MQSHWLSISFQNTTESSSCRTQLESCEAEMILGVSGGCSVTCGQGSQRRDVACKSSDGALYGPFKPGLHRATDVLNWRWMGSNCRFVFRVNHNTCHRRPATTCYLGRAVNRCPGTPPVEAQGCSRGVCERSRCPLFKMLSTRRGGMKSRSVRLSCFVVLFSSRCRVTAACTNREAGGTRPSRRATQ